MKLEKALEIATHYKNRLSPFCDRIEIAGSIRRQKPEVKDIEIVCIPTKVQVRYGLYEVRWVPHNGFVSIVDKLEKIKGEATGKYTQRRLPEGINLDLFMAAPDNWGLIFAIRTGSAGFSHMKLATGWAKRGYKSRSGVLVRDGRIIPVREEEDLFKLIGLAWVEPEYRN